MAISEYALKSKYICNVAKIASNHTDKTVFWLIVAKTLTASPKVLAKIIFLNKPTAKRLIPLLKSSIVSSLSFISFATVSYLTIGPAINWGNKAKYAPKSKTDLALFTSPR